MADVACIEKPLIFSAPMVRAILEGRKTQTRRLLHFHRDWPGTVTLEDGRLQFYPVRPTRQPALTLPCRYQTGMRLWVKETHAWADEMADGVEREDPVCVAYRADRTAIAHEHENVHTLSTASWNWDTFKWRPSIYMPRWASRITLEVSTVRVQRLQDISEEDAFAEGAVGPNEVTMYDGKARDCFARLWDSINRDRASWDENPWVVAVTFARVTP